MKQNAQNTFQDGINYDLHPIVTPNSVLTDNLNGTFITYNGNEFCLQNDKGNIIKAFLTPGFTPIGIKEHNGVIYICSCDKNKNCEIGTYPGIDWSVSSGLLNYRQYTPLQNLLDSNNNSQTFKTKLLDFDLEHPVDIEIQDSYDGSVNLILTNNKDFPRIINTGFSITGDRYTLISRSQDSNKYSVDIFDNITKLIENSNKLTVIDLDQVTYGGQLKGGNYSFYLRYGDEDGNKTDIICESGIVSIFKGDLTDISSISGALADELTDKSISFEISNIDTKFNKIYLSYTREYSDTNGYRMSEAVELTKGFKITGEKQIILITGFEETNSISEEELNITYHTISTVKTIAQQQDMLFLGNIGTEYDDIETLQNLSYQILVSMEQDKESVGYVDPYYYKEQSSVGDDRKNEYYNPKNIYDKLGYWPDEYYRLGIVYIKSDGSKTQAFNLRGCDLQSLQSTNQYNGVDDVDDAGFYKSDPNNRKFNKYGVFKTPKEIIGVNSIIKENGIYPWYFKFRLPEVGYPKNIIGYFIVRQKRIPTTILQGLKIGIEADTKIPVLQTSENKYITESFLTREYDTNSTSSTDANKFNLKLIYKPQSPTGEIITDESASLYYEFFRTTLKTSSESIAENGTNIDQTIFILLKIDRITNKVKDAIVSNNESIKSDYQSFDFYERSDFPKDPLWIWWDDGIPKGFWDGGFSSKEAAQRYYSKAGNKNKGGFAKITRNSGSVGAHPNWASLKEAILDYCSKFPNSIPKQNFDNTIKSQDSMVQIDTENNDAFVQLGSAGLLTLEPSVNNTIRGMLDGSGVELSLASKSFDLVNNGTKLFVPTNYKNVDTDEINVDAVYINNTTNTKVVDNRVFTAVVGNAASVNDFGAVKNSVGWTDNGSEIGQDDEKYPGLVRGIYTPYIGFALKDYSSRDVSKLPVGIYNLRKVNIEDALGFTVRMNNHSPFYSVSELRSINDTEANVYRGDCYTVTETHRIIRNFIDPNYPYTKTILDPDNWNKNYKGRPNMTTGESTQDEHDSTVLTSWSEINLTDVNTVSLGHWVSFKCLSSYNLGLRSIDSFNTTETSLLGSERKFYPLNTSTATPDKIEDSWLLNDGYSATVNKIRRMVQEDVPFIKQEYGTRVMFSNKNVTDQFVNGYRVFQGLSYQDYDKQYGSITKLVPWGNNLFCVFEHGLAILAVNEKALLQTTTEQTIHIYGHGVLPEQMSIVSQDYGTKYAESVIRTPIGIYGIDVDAKKIWRFTDKQGFETISDMKIESLLNDTLTDIDTIIGKSEIRTHYNSFKGDVIFTWYTENNINSICYNERQNIWTTRYNWVPIVSENANGYFFSLQKGEDPCIIDNMVANAVGIYNHDPKQSEPTKWYGKQYPFEFEFVVSDPIGVHKIFENLQIVSNNVQPEELQFEFIGDAYMFNKERIYHTTTVGTFADSRVLKAEYSNASSTENPNITDRTDDKFWLTSKTGLVRQQDENDYKPFRNASILNDRDRIPNIGRIEKTKNATNQYHLVIPQECRNIESWGRRLGNIHYKFDSWYTNIEPILYDARLNDPQITHIVGPATKWNSARIRDKWCKIRIRYSGEDLAVITAIKTILNI